MEWEGEKDESSHTKRRVAEKGEEKERRKGGKEGQGEEEEEGMEF